MIAPPDPATLLQHLIRFDTTNPPGNEAECMAYLEGIFAAAGVETRLLGASPERPNLIVRVRGRGEAPPLLLQGHVDVVTTENQDWEQPPFEGRLVDGYVWGRGALDMKGGVAMMAAALLKVLAEGTPPPGDVVLCVLADEEAGGVLGAQHLVEHHPETFAGIRYGIGEGGGPTQHIGGRRFYPVMVAEKRACRLRATLRGPGGHASRAHSGGTMAKLAAMLGALDRSRLRVHITPAAKLMLEAMRDALPEPVGDQVGALLDPGRTDAVLDEMGAEGLRFDPVLHHTVNATIVQGGHKINVIPSEVVVDLDGRMLPGFEPEEFIAEVRDVIGSEPEVELLNHGPRLPEPDLGSFYQMLTGIVREADPGGVPVPMLMTGATDARHFARLGIRGYGFLPLDMPPEFRYSGLVHAADERVPAAALRFGAEAVRQVVIRYR